MSTNNVGRTNAQVKLVFDSGDGAEFRLDRLIEEVGLELKSFATSAGLIMMKAIMKAEEGVSCRRAGYAPDRGEPMVQGRRIGRCWRTTTACGAPEATQQRWGEGSRSEVTKLYDVSPG